MSETPLTDAIRRYRETAAARLHVPSHGGGPGSPGLFALFGDVLTWDVTEQPELDDLSHPDGPIMRSQAAAAEFFGAEEAYFLTGGATLGVHAAIFAALRSGGALLAARDSHRSLLGAAFACGADVVLLDPAREALSGASLGPEPDAVEQAFAASPDVRAVLINYPSYLGVASELGKIAAIAHRHGALVVADAAHGAHFGLHPALPPAALAEDADLVVMGMHKTGGALTQSAMLLLGPRALPFAPDVRLALSLLGTSSPSYLLMVSIEQAVKDLRGAIPARLATAIAAAREITGPARVVAHLPQDPLRIALRSHSASQVAEALAMAGIRGEYVDGDTALYCVPFGAQASDLAALRQVAARLLAPPPPPDVLRREPARISPRAALLAPRRPVDVGDAVGLLAADVVAPVPPGIPALWPGERITGEIAGYLGSGSAKGRRIMGIDHEKLWVVAE